MRITILGGGAAGFFAALAAAQANPKADVVLLERSAHLLSKVKISGGGRCNVTHACFDPAQLTSYYPRGGQALRGPFTRFQPKDTVAWFQSRGVPLKTEADGRMFPTSNNSQTIIDCLMAEAKRLNVKIQLNAGVDVIRRQKSYFTLLFRSGEVIECDRLILATGSGVQGWEWAKSLGHTLEPAVPSLFTFTIKDPRLDGLAGVSVPKTSVRIAHQKDKRLAQSGSLLITHWGLSGPAVLKLSAWGARVLHDMDYKAGIVVDWLPEWPEAKILTKIQEHRQFNPRKAVCGDNPFPLPRRLWNKLVAAADIGDRMQWAETSNHRIMSLVNELHAGSYPMTGKSPFKEEFVTCGGIRLDEVDFRTMMSKKCPGLYFAGEVLDVDAVTGGFNFQNAWTTGWLTGTAAGTTD